MIESSAPLAFPLPDRAVIAVSGCDSRHFLNNLVTANVEALKPGHGTLAALLTPQGKIIADMLLFDASDDEALFLLDVPAALADDLVTRLQRYRLRAQVGIDRLGAEIATFVVLDAAPIEGTDFYAFPDPRAESLGQRLYGPVGSLEKAVSGFARSSAEAYHARRLMLGIPESGRDFMASDTFPHEANMDQLGGVDFAKGCYIGQEVVSRMEHRGNARTRALTVRFLNGFGVIGGLEVLAGDRVIGRIGECAGDRAVALVRVDRLADALAAGQPITAGGVPIELARPGYARFAMEPA